MNDNLPSEKPSLPPFGLAVASLVLGIVSVAWSVFVVGAIVAIVGIILGMVHISQKGGLQKLATWGVILSCVGLIASGLFGYKYYRTYLGVKKIMEESGGMGESPFAAWVGKEAPDLTVTDLEGKTIRLSDLKGRRVVLDFWATWCPPCRKEIPHFIELRRSAGDADLAIIGISSEEAGKIKTFAEKSGVNYPLAAVGKKDLSAPYSEIKAIPTTFFIDRKGVIQEVAVGYHSFKAIKEKALAPDYVPPGEAPVTTAASRKTGKP